MMLPVSTPTCKRHLLRILLAIVCLGAVAPAQNTGNCTAHDVSTRPDCPDAIAFFQKLQAAVKAGDKAQLASMASYPLSTSQGDKRVKIRNRQQFLRSYSQLFTPAVICAIEAAKPSNVWGNYQGFMVGQGVIWWDQVIPSSVKNPEPNSGNYPFKIIAINNQDVSMRGCAENKP
jgi:hypothetical protein